MHKISFIIALIGALSIAACKPTPSMRGPQKLEGDYEQQLRKWTRSDQVYNSLNSTLLVHATYLSPEFREAFRQQYMRVFGLDPRNDQSDLKEIAGADGQNFEFFVFADSTKVEWNNLEAKEAVWRLGLWGSEGQEGATPVRVQLVKGRGPNLKAFFPYLNQFGRCYLVVFPHPEGTDHDPSDPNDAGLVVKLSSVFGIANLSWKVTE